MNSVSLLERSTSSCLSRSYLQSNYFEASSSAIESFSVNRNGFSFYDDFSDFSTYRFKNIHITPGQLITSVDFKNGSTAITPMWLPNPSGWIKRVFSLCKSGDEDAALKEISLATTDFKLSQKWGQLALDIAGLNYRELPDIILIGLLRNTYSIRNNISTWKDLLKSTEEILITHKKNPQRLLRGLRG